MLTGVVAVEVGVIALVMVSVSVVVVVVVVVVGGRGGRERAAGCRWHVKLFLSLV